MKLQKNINQSLNKGIQDRTVDHENPEIINFSNLEHFKNQINYFEYLIFKLLIFEQIN